VIKQVIKSLFEQVLEDLDDMTPRLVLADALEDAEEFLHAECWRWLARHRVRPSIIAEEFTEQGRFFWNTPNYQNYTNEEHIPRSRLPLVWITAMSNFGGSRGHGFACNKCAVSEKEAFLEALRAYVEDLTDEQRKEVQEWIPPA
jgi:hypothetical protein